jgi:hypothetical protein
VAFAARRACPLISVTTTSSRRCVTPAGNGCAGAAAPRRGVRSGHRDRSRPSRNVSNARRTTTSVTRRRYSPLARTSSIGRTAAPAVRAAAAIVASVKARPINSASASSTRTTVGATLPSARRAALTASPSNCRAMAAWTTEIAWSLRLASLAKTARAGATTFGTRSAVTSSPGCSPVAR